MQPRAIYARYLEALSRGRFSAIMSMVLVVMFIGVLAGYIALSGFVIVLGICTVAFFASARARGRWPWVQRPVPCVEGARLVQRRGDNLILSEIDLTQAFQAECTYHSDYEAFIRVRQGAMDMRFAVPIDTSDQAAGVVRDVLGLQWPPPSRVSI
jgi:hypothetical protein